MTDAFEGFTDEWIDVGDVVIHTRSAGSGPPLLLLHGYPETMLMWRQVAADLVGDFTVVLTDLRGYGSSGAPPDDDQHLAYSKRSMASDQAAVMDALGHASFFVVGHDRGGRVAHRLALDHPERVVRLAVLDIVPTLHMFENVDRAMAQTYFHWFFLTQPDGLPERLIGADPDGWVDSRFVGRHSGGSAIDPEAIAEYRAVFSDPARVAATCADYRAAATIDLVHDRADRDAGRRVSVPLLALWGESSYVGRSFDVVTVWEAYADDVSGRGIAADHYMPEEAPEPTARALRDYFLPGMRP